MKETYKNLLVWTAAAVLLLTGLWCRQALAEEEAAAPQGSVLEIANDYAGEGMDRPYSAGYMPAVADGTAQIVLPLRPADPDLAPPSIQVAVDLGSPEAPFVFQNYDLRVPLEEAAGGGELYLISLSLPLEPDAEGGRYPVAFMCSGIAAGSSFSQTFTVFVTVPAPDPAGEPDGYEPGGESDGGGSGGGSDFAGSSGGEGQAAAPSPEPTQAPQPKLMVVSQAVAPSPVEAGTTFALTVTLRNTSAGVPASNLLLTMEGDGDVYAADGQNSAYFPLVKAGETFSASVSMTAAPEASPGPRKITLHAGYDGPQGSAYTQDENLTVQVVQPVRFAVDRPDFPSSLAAGETWSLPVNVMNLGRSTIRNVSASVEAPGIRTQSTLFLGNLESGTAKKGTLYAFVGPKSEAEGEARYGKTEGLLKVTCEDEAGAVHEEEIPFALGIDAPVIRSTSREGEETEEEEEPALQWQLALAIGGGIAAAAAALWCLKRRQERRLDEDS